MCILVCPTRNSNLVFFTEPAGTEVGCNQPRPQIATQPSSAQKVIQVRKELNCCLLMTVLRLVVLVSAVLALWLASVIYEQRRGTQAHQSSEFCYVNPLERSGNFRTITATRVTKDLVTKYADFGQPFVVSGATRGWAANSKWNHSYFVEVFNGSELFSSTFATERNPHFSVSRSATQNVYYGIFLNERTLADLVAGDYRYPEFIPAEWRVTGPT